MRKKSPYLAGLAFVLFVVVALVFPFSGGAAPQTKSKDVNASANALPDYDAFGSSTKRSAAIAQNAQNPAEPQAEGGHLVQSEPRLGVPTFLWASSSGPARSVSQSLQSGAQTNTSDVARDYLGQYASRYRLTSEDVLDARVAGIHDTGKGAIIVKYKQQIGDVEVFRDAINVIMNRQYQLIALSGYLTSRNEGAGVITEDFSLSPSDALAKALEDLTGGTVSSSNLQNVARASNESSPYLLMTADKNETQNFSFVDEPARVKKVFYHLVDEYIPAYYVEADVYLPTTSGNTLSAITGGFVPQERAYSYVISATDGQVLFRHNLIAEQKVKQESQESSLAPGGFTYRVWADPGTGFPYDTPAGNAVHPKVATTPDGVQYPFVSPQNVQLPNFPFSQNDPWLAPGSTTTSGNNVDAYANLVNAAGNVDNGFGPAQEPPVDPPLGDHHAFISATDSFIFNHQPDVDAFSATARQGAITQLFYDINFLHDWFYDAGFNEAAGNAQTNNFGRGGLQNDNIKGQVEDTASFSNANMLTPADGARPRMRMYNFPNLANTLDIQAPAAIVGKVSLGISQTGLRNFDVNSDIVIATFSNSPSACTITNAAALDGKIAMFDFDNTDGTGCSFSTRITRIHATTAAASLMVYTSANPTAVANITGLVASHTKGVGVISWNSGQTIKSMLAGANTVTARLLRVADRDGAIDQQVLFHEWGHYISNRLIGDGNGLNANYAGGLGEGWGDFTAMLLTVREDDTSTPSNSNWDGAYALATYATSGVPFNGTSNNGYYFGIRRYPYSTDMTKNPLTFHHIQNGVPLPVGPPVGFGASGTNNAEVHNTGEVWATMLWECYAALLRDTQGPTPRFTFQQAQDRMKNYLVAAYKMTPLTPTLLEARDAVLAAAFAYDYNDGLLFAQAFAKRGAGYGAISPDRFSGTNSVVTESYVAGGGLTYVGATLDDSAENCDNDGYLDKGEKGLLSVTLRNSGHQNLFNSTATVSTSDPNITFPNGATITFPASQPGQSLIGSVTVAASNAIAGIDQVHFTINFEDTGSPAVPPVTADFFENVNVNEIPSSTATDTFDAKPNLWTISSGTGAGLFTNAAFEWVRTQAGSANRVWFVPDAYFGTDEILTSPVMTVNGGGSLNLQFDHTFGFEFDGGGNYDGGVVEVSVNGGAFIDMGATGGLPNYNGTILNYSGDVNPLKGRSGFVQNSGGMIHTSFTKAIAPGSTVQVRFRAGSDSSVGSLGWTIDNVAFSGVVETPFNTPVADSSVCPPDPGPTPVVITMAPATAPAGAIGDPYSLTVTATGGSGSYTYSTIPVVLPAGLSGSTVGGSFQLTGTPTQIGTYLVTVNADDGASHQGSITYTIVIGKATPTITWNNPADITYPTALSSTHLNATASVPGVLTYTPSSGTILNAGNAQTLTVNFVPTDTTNYNNTSKSVSINVLKATPTITWNNPADIEYGTVLTGTQLNATTSVPGTFTYTPPAGNLLNVGAAQTLSVNFVPTDTANYNNASKSVMINVSKANQTISFGALSDRPLSTATFTVSGTASSNLLLSFAILSGPATINNSVVSLTGIGPVTVRATQPGDSNYNAAAPVDQTFTVTPAVTVVAVSSNLNPSVLGQPVTFTASVTSGAATPTGTVTFKDGANTLGTGMLNGSGQATVSTSALAIGTHAITAEYGGDANHLNGSGTLAGGQLVNSPPSGVIQFSVPIYSVNETAGSVAITVTRTGDISAPATVDYVTNDGSNPSVQVLCSTISGIAGERCDFTRAAGTIRFAAGQASGTFTVLITDDSYIEGQETVQLVLSNPSAGSQFGASTTATLTINDDDIAPSGNPVDNANAFVESLYHDFLNRTPDSAGLIFWTNEMTSCGLDQACIDQKRVNVAAAFFLSIEFQQTGYLVERLYKTAYGDAQGTSTFGGPHSLPVPVVRLNEFLPDTQKIGSGVFVGQPGWETALENNKVAFIDEFVLRSRFTSAFPGSMTNAVFVDTLNANAGNPLSTTERNQLVGDLNAAVRTRAQVLRVIAEHQALVAAEANRAFVLMQYFGFLRRNPNDAPDTDHTGYDFWLTKLNQFNGNFVAADMVEAFINSGEYRQRFGN